MPLKILFLCFIFSLTAAAQAQLEELLSPGSLPYLKKSKLVQVSSYDTTGGNNDRINIHPGKTAEIFNAEGPGVITRIWVTIDSRDPHFLRRILLRMYWDGEENPSVEVPVGDFFGTGFEYKHYYSQFVGMTSGGYYSYFPMPFNKSARIEVVNETGKEIFAFYYHISYQKLEQPLDEDVAYFHALWKRDIRTNYPENYTVLDAEGEGHFVGLNLNMQPYNKSLWYLEGDEMVYVDGESFPSVYGTGTEDYFTSGWYFKDGAYAAPYHGVILKDDSTARIAAYRFHVGDVIPFKKSLKFTIEHGHKNEEKCDFSSTAYWYQKEPHKKFPEMMKPGLRIPLRVAVPNGLTEAEGLPVNGAESISEDMSDYGAEWSGLKQLRVNSQKAGETFTLDIPGAAEKAYNIDLYFTQGPDYGDVEIFHDSEKVGEYTGYNEEVFPGGKVSLMNIKAGDNNTVTLSFVVKGKNEKSTGYNTGIDGFLMEPVRDYISEWYMIGPFPNPRESDVKRYGLDTPYPPEKEFKPEQAYNGAENQKIVWKLEKTPVSGFMSLWQKYDPYEFVVAYAQTFIYSPGAQTVPLFLGSDDGAKIFLNGKEIYRFLDVRISAPDQDKISLDLKEGWNSLLLKIENNFGGYGFYARILDKNDSLIITPKKKNK
jgi:hypothetical protein